MTTLHDRPLRRPILTLLTLFALLGGCDMPVYFGIEAARAAGISVPPLVRQPTFGEPAAAVAADGTQATASVRPTTSGSVIFSPPVPKPAGPDDVVGLVLDNAETASPQALTFGQIFGVGQVPRGMTVVATTDGRDVPTQADVKTTHPDGSARMAVVTVVAPAPANLMLVRRPVTPSMAIDLATMADRVDVTVNFLFRDDGTAKPARFDLARLLADAARANKISYWLRGPLVTEGRIEVPVVGSMRLTADIRAYADGTVRTDVQFNNDIAMQPVGGKLVYDVSIAQAGSVAFEQAGVTHYQYQTWHREVWNRPPPTTHVVHDVRALARAGAVHNYDLTTGVKADILNGQTRRLGGPGFGILGNADVTMGMGMTGGRPDIGPVTQANSIWLTTQHRDAARYAIAQADAAGSIPWHYFETDVGTYATVARHPKLWPDYRGGQWDTKALTQRHVTDHKWEPDIAHQPDLSYVPYILTGTRYRLDQLHAQATGSILGIWPTSRQDGRAIVTSRIEQVRGRAWGLRVVNESLFVCPDDSPLRPYFAMSVANSLAYLESEAKELTKGEAYGWFRYDTAAEPGGGLTSPWMDDFLANTLALLALQGNRVAADLVRWTSNFLVGRFLAEERGFHPRNATSYRIVVFPTRADAPYMTWREVGQHTIAFGFGKDGSVWANNDGAYVAGARGTLGSIVSVTGSPDARKALDWLNRNAPYVSLDALRAGPTWNIVPLDQGEQAAPR